MIESFRICCVKQRNVDLGTLRKIASLKAQHWHYSIDEQINWITKNIKDDDYHLMIINENEEIMAYMNMVNCLVELEGKIIEMIGIGNVCVHCNYMNHKLGKLLMDICRYYLNAFNKTGILLCKERLAGFYTKVGWRQYFSKKYYNEDIFEDCVFFSDEKYDDIAYLSIKKVF